MQRSSALFFGFAVVGLLLLVACRRESKPLPPGNWQGRCASSPDSSASTEFGAPPTTFVRDGARMLSAGSAAELERVLSAFQLETCHHVTVVTVASLEGSTLESYSLQYANRIGLGYRRLNNGIMLLISPNTRQARIQIGCGLEDVISDKHANEIMQRDLLPFVQEGYWAKGVHTAVASLTTLARKKAIAEPFRPEGCRQQL
jgi:uncharacterized protein